MSDDDDAAELVRGNTALAVRLHALLARAPENLVFSPFSISSVLATLAIAARGQTASELYGALGHSLSGSTLVETSATLLADALPPETTDTGAVELRAVNTLWIQRGEEILRSFEDRFARMVRGTTEHVDFVLQPEEARRRINAQASQATRGRIEPLVPGPLEPMTRRVLVSAVYFKAAWEEPFNAAHTRPMVFRGTDGETRPPGMRMHHRFPYAEDEHLQLLELPYDGEVFSLVILLPREPDGLARCEQRLGADPGLLPALLDGLRTADVQVTMPKFTSSSMLDLRSALGALGVRSAYDATRAEFPGIGQGFALDAVIHAAWIEVNEQGTEAAGATAARLTLGASLGVPRRVDFVADHPFLFLIRDRVTRTVLFLGRVTRV